MRAEDPRVMALAARAHSAESAEKALQARLTSALAAKRVQANLVDEVTEMATQAIEQTEADAAAAKEAAVAAVEAKATESRIMGRVLAVTTSLGSGVMDASLGPIADLGGVDLYASDIGALGIGLAGWGLGLDLWDVPLARLSVRAYQLGGVAGTMAKEFFK